MTTLPLFSTETSGYRPNPLDNYIQPTLGHGLRIWWAYYWPTTLITVVLSLGFEYLIRALLRYMFDHSVNIPTYLFMPMVKYHGYVINGIVSLFIFRYVLGKRFRDFRIALLASANPVATNEVRVTLERVMVIWWAFLWRWVVYTIVGYIVVILPLSWYVGMFRPGRVAGMLFFGSVGFVLGGAIALFVIYSSILDEDFGDVRVSLLPLTASVPVSPPSIPIPYRI